MMTPNFCARKRHLSPEGAHAEDTCSAIFKPPPPPIHLYFFLHGTFAQKHGVFLFLAGTKAVLFFFAPVQDNDDLQLYLLVTGCLHERFRIYPEPPRCHAR